MSSEPNEQSTETRVEETAAPVESAHPGAKAGKTRSPIERVIVWVAILLLAGFAGVEGFASYGYTQTLDALSGLNDNDNKDGTKLSSVLNGFPSEESADEDKRAFTYRWFSFVRTYEVLIRVGGDKDDPIVLGFSTPDADAIPEKSAEKVPPQVGEIPDTEGLTAAPAGGGQPGHGGGQPGHGNRGRRGPRGVLGQLARENIQTKMKLTDDQKSKIQKLAESSRLSREDFEGKSPVEMIQMRADSRTKIEAALKGILDDKQFARAKQLSLQSDGPAALVRDDVQASLKLTDAQKAKIKAIRNEQNEALGKLADSSGRERFSKMRETLQESREKFQKLLDELTPMQKKSWTKLLGPIAPSAPTAKRKRPA